MKKTLLLLVLALTALLGKAAVGDVFENGVLKYEIAAEPTDEEYGKVNVLGLAAGSDPTSLYIWGSTVYNNEMYIVDRIRTNAFNGNKTLRWVFIKYGVTTIDPLAFNGCTYLTSLNIASSVTKINTGAFTNCPYLTSIYYSTTKAPTEVSGNVFDSTMKSVYLPTNAQYYNTVASFQSNANFANVEDFVYDKGTSDFYFEDGCRYLAEGIPTKTKTASLLLIGFSKFGGSTNAADGIIKPTNHDRDLYTVRGIDKNAFKENVDITQLDMSNEPELMCIDNSAFYEATNLEKVIINSAAEMGELAFYGCTKLNDLDIKCKNIGPKAFIGCPLNGTVILREGIELIEDLAFCNCGLQNYTTFIIPASVYGFGTNVVSETNVESFSVASGNTNYCVYEGVLYSIDHKTLVVCAPKGAPTKIHPDVKEIMSEAFSRTSEVTSLELPYGLETIGGSAFANSSIINVAIPSSVTSIGGGAFGDCKSLSHVRCNVPRSALGTYAFIHCNITEMYVPYDQLEAYRSADFNLTGDNSTTYLNSAGDFRGSAIIKRIIQGSDDAEFVYGYYDVIDNNQFTENGKTYAGKARLAYQETFSSGATIIRIPTQVTLPNTDKVYKVVSVGSEILGAHNHDKTSKAAFSCTSVDTIAPKAFNSQKMLQSANINGDQAKNIGDFAFSGCTNLHELMIQGDEITTGKMFFGANADDFVCFVKWDQVGKTLNSINEWPLIIGEPQNKISAYYKDSRKVNAISVSIPIDWTDSNLDVYAYNGVILGSKTVKTTKVVASKAGKGLIIANVVPDSIYRLTRLTNPLVEELAADLIIGNPDEDTKASVYAKLNNKVFTFNQDEAVFEPATSSSIVKAGTAYLLLPYSNKTELTMITGKWKLDFYDYTKPGDVNGDGVIDIVDVNAIISDVINGADYNSQHDANKDGVVDVTDINYIVNIMLGL